MRWAIITGMYNVADLAAEFCSYHRDLGVDRIYVADYGSKDGTLEVLEPFRQTHFVELVRIPTHHFAEYDPSNAILQQVREENGADWISFLDADEFLVGPAGIKKVLEKEWLAETEAIAIPRANLTAVGPVRDDTHYLSRLTLKILATDNRVSDPLAPLSSPWIFTRLPPKMMVRVAANLSVIPGDHAVIGNLTPPKGSPSLEVLHLPLRRYASFEQKVRDTAAYFEANPEFEPGLAWHWRRWVELLRQGNLREEYEKQFLADSEADRLLAEGKLTLETRLADWQATA